MKPRPGGSTPFDSYLEEIARHPRLSADEEAALFATIHDPDSAEGDRDAARTRLVEANLRIVVYFAKPHARRTGRPIEEFVSVGNLAAMKAVGRFRPDAGTRFSTCLGHSIRSAFRDWLRSEWVGAVSLPEDVARACFAVARGAAGAGVDPRLADRVADAAATRTRVEFGPWVEHGHSAPPDDDDGRDDLHERKRARAAEGLARLGPRHRGILARRYGLDGRDPESLSAVAAELGVSKQRVSQLEQEALAMIRAGVRAMTAAGRRQAQGVAG